MPMTLYDNPASPYCRKVKVVLHETGFASRVEIADAVGHPLAPDKMPTQVNPLGKIPTLTRDDGGALFDSRVICRYLDTLSDGGLYPETRLWDVLTLEAMADGMMDAALLMVYEGRSRPEDMQYQPWVEAQWAKIERALDTLESRWVSHLSAKRLDMGQVAVGCALGYLDFRHESRDWRGTRPGLAKWFEGFGARDSMVATRPRA